VDRVVIAGGGALGVMRALLARQRKLDVVQLERAAGARGASVRNFGLGVYSQVPTSDLYYRSPVAPGVVPVTGPGGRGMTCAPAIAEETFA
jgi:glycine/D-amino acid oxidase-like deaminating enzyme